MRNFENWKIGKSSKWLRDSHGTCEGGILAGYQLFLSVRCQGKILISFPLQ